MEKSGLLLDGNRGIYIPKDFVLECYTNNPGWSGADTDDLEVLLDPDHEWYWEAWESVLDNAVFTDHATNRKYKLYQDGDLFYYDEEFAEEFFENME